MRAILSNIEWLIFPLMVGLFAIDESISEYRYRRQKKERREK